MFRKAKALAPLFLISILIGPLSSPGSAAETAGEKVDRRLYVCLDGYVAVYSIDDEHKLVKTLNVTGREPPTAPAGVEGAGVFRGICADAASGRLYVTYNPTDELICYDLIHEAILWRNKYGNHADSPAITPDGKTLYVPFCGDTQWWVINPETGDSIKKIEVAGSPHNTNCAADGARMYLETLTQPWVYVADTKSNELVGKIGPFSNTVRPFSLSNDGNYVFACVNGLLGFEVGAIESGKVIFKAEAKRPPEREAQVKNPGSPHGCPSHGVGSRPGSTEVWVTDSAFGYLHVFDANGLPKETPRQIASVPLFTTPEDRPEPGWVSFSIDGKFAYAPGDAVIDADAKRVIRRIPTSEKMIEIEFQNGKVVRAGKRMW